VFAFRIVWCHGSLGNYIHLPAYYSECPLWLLRRYINYVHSAPDNWVTCGKRSLTQFLEKIMSNQPYDEAEIIQEIIETIKNNSKSHSQIVQDLLARGIPANEVDALIRSVAKELYPEGVKYVKPPIDTLATNIGKIETIIRNGIACLLFIVLIIFDFSWYVWYTAEPCRFAKKTYPDPFYLWGLLIIPNLIYLFVIRILYTYTNTNRLSQPMQIFLGILSITIIPIAFCLAFSFLLFSSCLGD
jgi:hypothetical protein